MRLLFTSKLIVLLLAVIVVVGGTVSFAVAAGQPQNTSLTVKLVSGLTPVEQAAIISRNGGVAVSSIPVLRLHVITVQSADLPLIQQNYQSDSQVESIETNGTRKAEGVPTDSLYGVQWALARIGWESAFGTIVPTGSAKVALLDTGIDAGHPDLAANVIPGTSMLDGSIGQTDPNGHGTWMAGIVAASTNNGTGIAGVAYQGVSIMPVTVLDASGIGQDSDIIAGIVWAADHGADVILMAFSNPDFSRHLQDAVDYAWSKGAVLVAATGNSGITTPTFPAGNRNVIGVSGTDENDTLVPGSNIGQDVFLSAPGSNMYTTGPGGAYTYVSGTSSSSAVVAGVAAFMRAVDPTLTNGAIIGRLARSADAIGTAGDPDNPAMFGNGRINMAKALADNGSNPVQPEGAAPVGSGGPYIGPYTAATLHVSSISIGSASGSLSYGDSTGSVTYPVTLGINGNGSALPVTASGLPAGVTFTPSSISDNFTLTITPTATAPAAGSYSFTLTIDGKKSNSATLTVNSKNITVTADPRSKNYGDADPALTWQITSGSLKSGDNFTGALTRAAGESVGAYAIQQGTLALNNNYTLTYAGANLNIGKKAASVTPNAASKTYGMADPTLTGTLSGFLAGDNVTATYSRTTGETIEGSPYIISATLSPAGVLANYAITSNTANFTINKADQAMVTVSAPATATYGQTGLAASAAGGSGTGVYSYSAGSSTACSVNALTGAIAITSGTGTCSITAIRAGDGNYSVSATSATAIVTISKAPQSIIFGALTDKNYGDAPFTVSATVSTPLVASFTASGACSITGTTVTLGGAGSCTVTANQTGDASYNPATPVAQTFTIRKAAAIVKLSDMIQTYSGNALTPTATTIPAGLSIVWTGLPLANAGFYPVTATVNDANYEGSASGAFTINRAAANVTVWPTASAIMFGQTLASSTLSGGAASVAGSFGWTHPSTVPIVGTTLQNVTYTPSDIANYNPATGMAGITVNNVVVLYNINATVEGANGSITPPEKSIVSGDNLTLTVTPANGYLPLSLKDNDNDVTSSLIAQGNNSYSYTLNNIAGNHTISVSFGAAMSVSAYVSGSNGAITPTQTKVPSGGSSAVTIIPSTGYVIDTIIDNGASGLATDNGNGTFTYNLANITGNHDVKISFKTDPNQSGQKTDSAQVPAASHVGITIGDQATFTFDSIATPGVVVLNRLGALPGTFPAAYKPVANKQYDITAPGFTGASTVCLTYHPNDLANQANENLLQLFHFNTATSVWENLNALVDTTTRKICGTTTSFSPVVVGEPASGGSSTGNYTVTPIIAGGKGGTIFPAVPQSVPAGGGISFSFTPADGYRLAFVTAGAITISTSAPSYTVSNVSADLNVTATFIPITYTISAAVNGGNGTVSPTGHGVVPPAANQDYVITATPGYSISAIVDTIDGTPTNITFPANSSSFTYSLTNIRADHSIVASFKPNDTATITAGSDNNGTISPSGNNLPYLSGQSPTFTFTPNTGYKVGSIVADNTTYTAPGNSYTFAKLAAGSHTIAVSFVRDTFNITATVQGKGSIDKPLGNIVDRGSNVTYNFTPDAGYQLSGVVVNGSSLALTGSYTFTNVQVNQLISVTFTPITYAVSVISGANGVVTPSGRFTVNKGANQAITITPNPGYVIDTLTDTTGGTVATVPAATGASNYTYTLNTVMAEHVIAVTFKQNVGTQPVAITVKGTGTVLKGSALIDSGSSDPVVNGSNVTYTFTPGSDYRVGNVIVDGVNRGAVTSYTFKNVQASHTIVVNYIPDTFTISILAPGKNVGTITENAGSTVYNSGTSYTRTMAKGGSITYYFEPAANYHVSSVTVDGSSQGNMNSYTFSNVTLNHSLYVTFAKD